MSARRNMSESEIEKQLQTLRNLPYSESESGGEDSVIAIELIDTADTDYIPATNDALLRDSSDSSEDIELETPSIVVPSQRGIRSRSRRRGSRDMRGGSF